MHACGGWCNNNSQGRADCQFESQGTWEGMEGKEMGGVMYLYFN